MRNCQFALRIIVLVPLLVVGGSGHVNAAGFTLTDYGAQGIGSGVSAGGALAEDASTVWLNPASISRLSSQVQVVGHAVVPQFDFEDRGSVQVLPSGVAATLLPQATTDASGGKNALVPSLYYVHTIDDRLTFGVALSTPFGLATEYDASWKGRYHTINAEVVDLNINPALAFKVSDQFSVGAGLSLNYIEAEFTQALDMTAACLVAAQPFGAAATCRGINPTSATFGAGQGSNDGFLEQKARDVSFGFNLGLLYELNQNARLSIAYRSQINHKLDGDARFTLPATISAAPLIEAGIRSQFTNSGLTVGASLPDSFSISGYYRFHPQFAVSADATWTGWSDIQELRFVYDRSTTLGGSTAEEFRWKDVWRFGLGLHYYHDSQLTLRTGVGYDPTPIPSAALRSPRLPDADRLWLSIGASYKLNKNLSADIGYAHIVLDDASIARLADLGAILNGVYKSRVDILSLQLSYVFD